jgi:hypothetical protein
MKKDLRSADSKFSAAAVSSLDRFIKVDSGVVVILSSSKEGDGVRVKGVARIRNATPEQVAALLDHAFGERSQDIVLAWCARSVVNELVKRADEPRKEGKRK